MKSIGFGVCLGTVALLVTTGTAQSSKAAFSVTAAAPYSEVKSGEDVYVKVTLTNNLNRVVPSRLRKNGLRGLRFSPVSVIL
jgi:uncharacterized protein (DUF58 family)